LQKKAQNGLQDQLSDEESLLLKDMVKILKVKQNAINEQRREIEELKKEKENIQGGLNEILIHPNPITPAQNKTLCEKLKDKPVPLVVGLLGVIGTVSAAVITNFVKK